MHSPRGAVPTSGCAGLCSGGAVRSLVAPAPLRALAVSLPAASCPDQPDPQLSRELHRRRAMQQPGLPLRPGRRPLSTSLPLSQQPVNEPAPQPLSAPPPRALLHRQRWPEGDRLSSAPQPVSWPLPAQSRREDAGGPGLALAGTLCLAAPRSRRSGGLARSRGRAPRRAAFPGSPSAQGWPQEGTVQDQSSGALVLLPPPPSGGTRRRRTPPLLLGGGESSAAQPQPSDGAAQPLGTMRAGTDAGGSGGGTGGTGSRAPHTQAVLLPVWEGQPWMQPPSGLRQRAGRATMQPEPLAVRRVPPAGPAAYSWGLQLTSAVAADAAARAVTEEALESAATWGAGREEEEEGALPEEALPVEAVRRRRIPLLRSPQLLQRRWRRRWRRRWSAGVDGAADGPDDLGPGMGPGSERAAAQGRLAARRSRAGAPAAPAPSRTRWVAGGASTRGGEATAPGAAGPGAAAGVPTLRACAQAEPPCAPAPVPRLYSRQPDWPAQQTPAAANGLPSATVGLLPVTDGLPSVTGGLPSATKGLPSAASPRLPLGTDAAVRARLDDRGVRGGHPLLLPSPTRAAVAAAGGAADSKFNSLRSGGTASSATAASAVQARAVVDRYITRRWSSDDTFAAAPRASAAASGSAPRPHLSRSEAASRQVTIAITQCRYWGQLRGIVQAYGDELNAVHITAVLTRLARIQLPAAPVGGAAAPDTRGSEEAVELHGLLHWLERAFARQLAAAWEPPAAAAGAGRAAAGATPCDPQLGGRQLATCLAALARLRGAGWAVACDRGLLQLVGAAVEGRRFDEFNPQELCTLLSALAKLGHRPPDAWLAAAAAAVASSTYHLRGGAATPPRQLSTVLWAFASLRFRPDPAFMAAWFAASLAAMRLFGPYDISQALWALATLRPPAPDARGAPAGPPQLPPRAAPPGPTAACWVPPTWAGRALRRCTAVIRPGAAVPQDTCNALWAVARLGWRTPRGWAADVAASMLGARGPSALEVTQRPVDVAALLWALAALGEAPSGGTMARLMRSVVRLAGRMGEQDVANVLWAAAVLRYRPAGGALRALARRLAQLAARGEAGPQAIATVLWSCARLELRPAPGLLRLLLRAAQAAAPAFTPQSAALLLYCLARYRLLGWLPAGPQRPEPAAPQPRQQPDAAPGLWGGEGGSSWGPLEQPPEHRWGALQLGAPSQELGPSPGPGLGLGSGAELEPLLVATLVCIAKAGGCPPRTLPVLLWSLAWLGYRPGGAWMRGLLVHSVEVLPLLSQREALYVVCALLRLRYAPPALWLDRLDRLRRGRAEAVARAEAAVRKALAEAKAEARAARGRKRREQAPQSVVFPRLGARLEALRRQRAALAHLGLRLAALRASAGAPQQPGQQQGGLHGEPMQRERQRHAGWQLGEQSAHPDPGRWLQLPAVAAEEGSGDSWGKGGHADLAMAGSARRAART